MRQTRKYEIITGLFVLVALFLLFGMTFVIRGNTGVRPYLLDAEFANVAGLEIGSPVLVQGFRVGRVIEMRPGVIRDGHPTVVVRSKVARTIPVYQDATVTLVQQGFIGDKRLEINPGSPESGNVESGAMLTSIPPREITDVIVEATDVVFELRLTLQAVREFVTDEERIAAIDGTIRNVHDTTERLNEVVTENQRMVNEMIANMRDVSDRSLEIAAKVDRLMTDTESRFASLGESAQGAIDDIRRSSRELTERIDGILARAETVGSDAQGILNDARSDIRRISANIESASENLNRILMRIDAGEGTVGGLISDPSPMRDLRQSLSALRGVFVEDEPDFYNRRIPYARQEPAAAANPQPTGAADDEY